jgi:hypothetical protein
MPMPRMAEDDGGGEMRVSLSLSFSLPLLLARTTTTTTTTTGLLRPVWNGWLCLRTSWCGRMHVAVVVRALILQVVIVALWMSWMKLSRMRMQWRRVLQKQALYSVPSWLYLRKYSQEDNVWLSPRACEEVWFSMYVCVPRTRSLAGLNQVSNMIHHAASHQSGRCYRRSDDRTFLRAFGPLSTLYYRTQYSVLCTLSLRLDSAPAWSLMQGSCRRACEACRARKSRCLPGSREGTCRR